MKSSLRSYLVQVFLFACAMLLSATGARAADGTEYRLAGGDVIKVSVFQNPDLATETRVSEVGMITFPLIGVIKVGGLTLGEAETEIARRLRSGGFVAEPQVNISMSAVLGNQVSVLGQVNKPGNYPLYNSTLRLSQILAAAGGVAQTGGDIVIVSGQRGNRPFRTQVDVEDLYVTSKLQNDIVVAAGDSIFVPRAQMFYIYGQVQRPGSYMLTRNMTVMQALAQGGGLTQRGTERSLKLSRRSVSGQMEEIKPNMTDLVKPDDVINVGESLF
ncbi:polysaccharide export protein EpsE [Hydrocarboniphaga sp.]|uniref:polysaccharide export protein EpsE n=1 Tax=Hydrocarboniphaga sp. TaxID=2033016 RepID=UPI003D0FCF20